MLNTHENSMFWNVSSAWAGQHTLDFGFKLCAAHYCANAKMSKIIYNFKCKFRFKGNTKNKNEEEKSKE